MRSKMVTVIVSLAVVMLFGCASDRTDAEVPGNSPTEEPLVVRNVDTFAVESFVNAGWKRSRQQDESSLERVTSAWYGFFSQKDIELWFYTTFADAQRYGVPAAEQLIENHRGGERFTSIGAAKTIYADFMVTGNVVMLCEFDISACSELATRLE